MISRNSEERRSRPMTNEYELATVVELGNAEEVVLGEKKNAQVQDAMTLEFGSRWNEELDDND
jgi:hypothetical protein